MNFVDDITRLPGCGVRATEPVSSGHRQGAPSAERMPTAAHYRRRAEIRDRWHTTGAMLFVAAVAFLVFWFLPLPSAARVQSEPAVAMSATARTWTALGRANGVALEHRASQLNTVLYCE